jgi:hypothetical protein
VVRIRAAIYRANTETVVTIGNVARSIADWLVWRREVAPNAKQFVAQIRGAVNSARTQATQKGLAVRAADAAQGSPNDVVVNVDEKALADEAEALETVLGTLDGQLSLKNATTFVEV